MAMTQAQFDTDPWRRAETVPPALREFGQRLVSHHKLPATHFGAAGDRHHANGGHRSLAFVRNSPHCTNRGYANDAGSGVQLNWIRACDWTPGSAADMLILSRRLDRAVRAGLIEEVVEWYGNVDGDTRVDGFNNISNTVASSDASHLWHLHIRFATIHANNAEVMDRLFRILIGVDVALSNDELALLRAAAENSGYAKLWAATALRASTAIVRNDGLWQEFRNGAAEVPEPNRLAAAITRIEATAASDEARDAAMLAAINALASGGTSIDTTAVINEIRAQAETANANYLALLGELEETQAQLARTSARAERLGTALADAGIAFERADDPA